MAEDRAFPTLTPAQVRGAVNAVRAATDGGENVVTHEIGHVFMVTGAMPGTGWLGLRRAFAVAFMHRVLQAG